MLRRPQSHSVAGRIMFMKNSNETIGKRTLTFRVVGKCLNQPRYRMYPLSRVAVFTITSYTCTNIPQLETAKCLIKKLKIATLNNIKYCTY